MTACDSPEGDVVEHRASSSVGLLVKEVETSLADATHNTGVTKQLCYHNVIIVGSSW